MSHLVFTDLDGSLLDPGDYSFRGAEPALALLRRSNVPLVLVTSKTRLEVEALRAQLDNDHPFVVENGGGVFFPRARGEPRLAGTAGREKEELRAELRGDYYVVTLGIDYAAIRAFVENVGSRFGMRGFGDMSVAEVAARTGLELEGAERARRREFSEPFVLDDPRRLDELESEARRHRVSITRGGRFFHLVGAGQDKGKAVRIVTRALAAGAGELRTVGLGDSDNDLPMLEAVDIPVVIPRPDGSRLQLSGNNVIVAPQPGSRGWNQAVLAIVGE